jgi:hypothetical protein
VPANGVLAPLDVVEHVGTILVARPVNPAFDAYFD